MVIEFSAFGYHVFTLAVGKTPDEVIYNSGGEFERAEYIPFGFATPDDEYPLDE